MDDQIKITGDINMKKRIIALIIAGASLASLTACGILTKTVDPSSINYYNEDGTFNYSAGLDENGFFIGVKASEVVNLPDYKGIEVEKSQVEATDEEVQEQVDGVLQYYTTYEQITDGVIADGDTVNIDYVGSIDGVEFDGGSTGGMGTDVIIGVTQYIDDFLEQLIGHKPGENFDIEVTFPEDYGNEELNGKDAIFNITVNYIQGEAIEPELTDEIAADYGFDSVESLLDDIRAWVEMNKSTTIFTEIAAEATCDEVPELVMNYFYELELDNVNYYASMYGVSVEEYCSTYMGVASFDEYFEQNREGFEENAVTYLVVQAIAELEGIKVTDEDIEEAGYADYIETYGAPYIKQYLLNSEIVPYLVIDNANIK